MKHLLSFLSILFLCISAQAQYTQYDDGKPAFIDSTNVSFWAYIDQSLGAESVLANQFNVENRSVIQFVDISLLAMGDFNDQYSGPRMFTLRIYDAIVGTDGGPAPGFVIWEKDFENTSQVSTIEALEFFTAEVGFEVEAGVFYIGLAATSQDNPPVVALSNWDDANGVTPTWLLHYFGSPGQRWLNMSDVSVNGDPIFGKQVLPLRAAVAVSTSTDDIELPSEIMLSQNYPNPFNPSTTIEYSLPKAANVVGEVYSVEGKRVDVWHHGFQEAGSHKVYFDAGNLPSGFYLYVLSVDGVRYTKNMHLLK